MQKSTFYILGGILLALAIIAGVFFFNKKAPQGVLSLKNETEMLILLYPEEGEVLYKTPSDKNFQKATSTPTTLPNMTVVHTGQGKATVLFEDNSNISIDVNTEITINHTKNKVDIFQSIGTTYHRVEKLVTGASYEVKTPGTLAAVRGTKFAVKYDGSKKHTKVSVTENRVDVIDLTRNETSTTTEATSTDRVSVSENQTVIVEPSKEVGATHKQTLRLGKTEDDATMRDWIKANKDRDIRLDNIKLQFNSRTELRDAFLKEIISIKRSDVDTTKPKVKEVPKRTEPEPVKEDKPKTPAMTDEQFDTAFGDLFIKYFYLDDSDTPCSSKLSADVRVREVVAFAKDNGRPFTKPTLLSFGKAIEAYCAAKDPGTKAKLQDRFNDEYPFSS